MYCHGQKTRYYALCCLAIRFDFIERFGDLTVRSSVQGAISVRIPSYIIYHIYTYIYTHVYVSYHILYNYISYIIYPVTHQSVYAFSPITLFCGGSPTVSTCTEASLCAFVVGCAWVPSLGRRALLSGAVAPLVQPLLPLPAAAGVPLRWHERIIHEDDVSFLQCFFFYIPNTHSGSKCGLSGVV